MMNPRYSVLLSVVMAAVALLAAGCSQGTQSDLGKTVDSSPQQMQQDEKTQVARIRDNANIPDKAKDAALKQREMAKNAARMANGQTH